MGRLFWDKLEVHDLREVNTDKSFIDAIETLIIDITNAGKKKKSRVSAAGRHLYYLNHLLIIIIND